MNSAADIRSRIAEIEDSIAGIESQLASLRADKEQLQLTLSSIVYPVLTVPPEIMSLVFLHGASESILDHVWTIIRHNNLRLAGVCRAWRDGVFSTCELWTSIALDCRRGGEPSVILKTWLTRSGGLPLDLRIRFSPNETDTVWSALTAHSTQWRNMELLTLDSVALSLEAIPSSLPLLQRLVIKGDVTLGKADNGHPVSTPQLRELNLDIPFVVYQLALPLSGITMLSLSGSSAAGISQILAFTPDLEVLAVSIYDFESYPVNTPCSLTRLHTLHCHTTIPPHGIRWLSRS
ncbi:hypothetical protein GGX14DRAFT_553740 [Mycena pura]|uniref:F-box domain-containing protein n=1 Tax=Mycena pura TaxID=153505 RepID=A0AAD7E5L9_9AGAR|nr:hypothetical protein GGX14DRAFT_553740 [Mycena pura]